MEATTSEAERPVEDSAQAQATETAEVNESGHSERPPEAPAANEDSVDFDLSDVPEDIRDHVKTYGEKVFKRAYTKKTQSLAEKERQRETDYAKQRSEYEKLQTQMNQLAQVAKEVIADPTKLEHYRQQLGYGGPPQFETVEDLTKFYEERLKMTTEQVKTQAVTEAQQRVMKELAQQRYDMALHTLRQDPFFERWENEITTLAREDAEIAPTYNGNNESQVLEAARKKFHEKLSGELESAKQQALESREVKKTATTVAPQKTVPNTTNQGTGRSQSDILARIRNRLPK